MPSLRFRLQPSSTSTAQSTTRPTGTNASAASRRFRKMSALPITVPSHANSFLRSSARTIFFSCPRKAKISATSSSNRSQPAAPSSSATVPPGAISMIKASAGRFLSKIGPRGAKRSRAAPKWTHRRTQRCPSERANMCKRGLLNPIRVPRRPKCFSRSSKNMRRQNRLPQFQRPLLLVRRGQSPSELAPLKLLTLMEILILGGAGMLGHKLFQRFRTSHPDTACTIRGTVASSALSHIDLFQHGGVIEGMDASVTSALQNLLAQEKPCVVINCIGVVKQRAAAKQPIPSIEINALLPHRLAESCRRIGARLIHFSTDCVFSGRRGNYTEEDISDAEDLYGRTKYLGEVVCGGALTLRTSIIGRELT